MLTTTFCCLPYLFVWVDVPDVRVVCGVGCRLVTHCKTLQHLSLSGNPRLTADDLRELLTGSSCPLTDVEFCGCGIVSPVAAELVDALRHKLAGTAPLTTLRLSCRRLTDGDVAGLRSAWTARWQRRSSVVVGRETVTLSVNDDDSQ